MSCGSPMCTTTREIAATATRSESFLSYHSLTLSGLLLLLQIVSLSLIFTDDSSADFLEHTAAALMSS